MKSVVVEVGADDVEFAKICELSNCGEAGKCQVMMQDVVENGRILFKSGSADLDKSSSSTLDQLAKISGACPNARIDISGHTDSVGDPGLNKTLSEKRAQAIDKLSAVLILESYLELLHLQTTPYEFEDPE